jgi:soluble P-type ATPase
MSIYNIVASTDEATVVAEYAAEYNVRPEKYQSEAELEREFIRQLTSQGYEYISVHNEAALIENLRNARMEMKISNPYGKFFQILSHEYIAVARKQQHLFYAEEGKPIVCRFKR